MIQLLFALALFVHGTRAVPVNGGLPFPATDTCTKLQEKNCIKDILILWDNSRSIGGYFFKHVVKPFITRLIKSRRLNVGVNSTNIGVISFSLYENTTILWNITDYPKQDDLLRAVDRLKYDDLIEDGTRTGYAFQIANKLFSKQNPHNYREDVEDVVLLFTDGQPIWRLRHPHYEDSFDFKNAIREADYYANELKKKNIKIVGLATGSEETIKKFEKQIQAWSTSKDHTFKAELEKLDDVLDKVVSATCCVPRPSASIPPPSTTTTTTTSKPSPSGTIGTGCDLICPPRQTVNAVIKPGETSAFAKWNEPTPTCEATKVFDDRYENPEGYFSEGEHQIKYVYSSKDDDQMKEISCYVDINVTACGCPTKEIITAKISPGQSKALVTWNEPKPNCNVQLKTADYTSPKSWFKIGSHTVNYVYSHVNGGFDMTCSVDIEVEGKLCGGVAYEPKSQECCCGNLHTMKPGHECCGMKYHNKALTKCCDSNANLMLIDETCPMENY